MYPLDEIMHAVCAHPVPLVVFVDPEKEDHSQRFYLLFRGLVADYVQQGLSTACTAHTGEKAALDASCWAATLCREGQR
jgi:hypothetical protein